MNLSLATMEPTLSAKSAQLAVGIVYGFAEGSLNGLRLRRALRAAGFTIRKPRKADIIICHSGGALVLPPKNKARLVLVINPTMWQGKPVFTSLREKLKFDYNLRKEKNEMWAWLLSGARNDMYILLRLPYALKMYLRYLRREPLRLDIPGAILVRNQHDSYCNTQEAIATNIPLLSLPGGHDDLWTNPNNYVEVVTTLLKSHRGGH